MIAPLAAVAVSAAVSLPGARVPRATAASQDTALRRPLAAPQFDITTLDVAGLRVGGKANDFEITAARLFGTVTRVSRQRGWFAGYASALAVNPAQCDTSPRRVHSGEVGRICLTAFLDARDVVRSVRIARVFSFITAAEFRAALVRRYGAISSESDGARMSLGWGPDVETGLAFDSFGARSALTAHYDEVPDANSDSFKPNPSIRVTLQLVDATWAAAITARPPRR